MSLTLRVYSEVLLAYETYLLGHRKLTTYNTGVVAESVVLETADP